MADEDFAALGGGEGGKEFGRGFLGEGDEAEGKAGAANGGGDELGVKPLAGDKRDRAGAVVVGREVGAEHWVGAWLPPGKS